MLAAAMGLLCILAGLWGMWCWRADLLFLMKGLVPVSLVFAGIVAMVAGLSGRKSGHG